MVDRARIAAWLRDSHARTVALTGDLSDAAWVGPKLSIVNPPSWEVGHLAWFYESFVLRECLEETTTEGSDALYDSSGVPHGDRWDLDVPDRAGTFGYLERTTDRVCAALESGRGGDDLAYMARYALYHQDMHNEAFAYTRQTLGYGAPPEAPPPEPSGAVDTDLGDLEFTAGSTTLGATEGVGFCFDNEKWAHPVDYRAFALARRAVSEGDFAAFVEEGGYTREELWDAAGWRWRTELGVELPWCWRRAAGGREGFEVRRFDRWEPIDPGRALCHVSWHEARAYCRWVGRRLPTEVEWEVAARVQHPEHDPWLERAPDATEVNAGFRRAGCGPCGEGTTPLRQLFGNAWEWTSDTFAPFAGFVRDRYPDYSAPWFDGSRRVLRGGSWASMPRLLRPGFRNFYTPDRRDVFAGFRTCAL